MAGRQDGIDVAALLGHLEDRVDVRREVRAQILAFTAVARAEAFCDDVASSITDRSLHFVQDEFLLIIGKAIQDRAS